MSDLIRRKDAIDAVMNTEPVFAVDSLEPYQKTKDVVEALEAVESADRPQGEWIPCSERLPSEFNDDEVVLATTDVDGRRVMLMLAVDVERFYLKGYVSAWMPSPKPWKGADDE